MASFRIAMLLCTLGLVAVPVHAQKTYEAVSADALALVLDSMNIEYEQRTDGVGDPLFAFEIEGYTVRLFTFGCEGDTCSSLQMYAGFSMSTPPALKDINKWNMEKRFSRAYLDDEGDPVVESDLDLEGGVSLGAVREFIETFELVLIAYAEHIGFNQ